MLEPVKNVDWHVLTALAAGKLDPKLTIAMAFRDLAENAPRTLKPATVFGCVAILKELTGWEQYSKAAPAAEAESRRSGANRRHRRGARGGTA